MSTTRMLILSGLLGLAACSATTEPSGAPSQVLPGDPPQGNCLPNGGGCVNPHQ